MRWIKPHYKYGDTRNITFFAWFPVSISNNGITDTRWLTTVTVKQELYYGYVKGARWINIEFIDRIIK